MQRTLRDDLVTGVKIDSDAAPDPVCEPCLAGKMHALPFRSAGTVTNGILNLVHGDLVSMPVASASGYRYLVAFHDNASGFHAAYPLRKKSDTCAAFTNFHAWAEWQTGRKLRAFHDVELIMVIIICSGGIVVRIIVRAIAGFTGDVI